MKRTTISILALALAGVLPIVCWSTSSGASNSPPKAGSVVGTFRLIGGPGPGESIPARGTVTFTQVAKGQATYISVAVSPTGRFIAHIPAGTWKVTASSPQFNSNQDGMCDAVRPITVKVGRRTHVTVLCEMK